MQKLNEDCFYFLTSTCTKGSICPYRHNPTVLTCNVICPAWLRGNCIDPACLLRHSTIQRPVVNNGTTCFFENTPMGCLKLDCTFVHLRPRPNLRNSSNSRPSTTNLVNKDIIKPTNVTNSPTSTINESVPTPQIIPSQSSTPKIETPPLPVSKIETPPPPAPKIETPPPPPPAPKIETPALKVKTPSPTIKPEIEQSIIPESSDNTKTTLSRVVVNRNVVIAESANTPNRKIVQGISNRVVVSSTKKPSINDSDSDLDDLIEAENHTNQTNSLIDIPFPCSVPSITNRLFTSTKSSTPPTNDTKPIRLNRDRLPAAKTTIPTPITTSTNGEKTSAGTGLTQDEERRTSRIERFKKKPISPPRSVLNSISSTPTRNMVDANLNDRKRPAPEQMVNESPPSKRSSATIGDLCSPPSSPRRSRNRHHHRRPSSSPSPSPSPSSSSSSSPSPPPLQRKSPPRPTYSSISTMNESAWNREVDAFLARTTKPKPIVLPKPVPLLSLRPRYTPPSIPQQQQQLPPPLMNSRPRPRQPPPPPPSSSMTPKRPLAPVITPPSKPIEQIPPTPPISSPKLSKQKEEEEEENQLLELDKPSDVVDTFALIDEALFEADEFLELM